MWTKKKWLQIKRGFWSGYNQGLGLAAEEHYHERTIGRFETFMKDVEYSLENTSSLNRLNTRKMLNDNMAWNREVNTSVVVNRDKPIGNRGAWE